MPLSDFYRHKAEQCDDLAGAETDPAKRAKHQEEAGLWREIARDIAKQDRAEGWPS